MEGSIENKIFKLEGTNNNRKDTEGSGCSAKNGVIKKADTVKCSEWDGKWSHVCPVDAHINHTFGA